MGVQLTAKDIARLPAAARAQIAEAQDIVLDGIRLADAVSVMQDTGVFDDKPMMLKHRITAACANGGIQGAQPVGRSDWDMPREAFEDWLDTQMPEPEVEYDPPAMTMQARDDNLAGKFGCAACILVLAWAMHACVTAL